MINTFGLQSRGTDADVYLARERGVVDRLLKQTNGTLPAMVKHIRDNDLQELASRLSDGLKEWNEVPSFSPRKDRGFSIRRSLLENAVVYIRGSVKDHVIRDATRSLIIELVQEISALGDQRKEHLTVAVDEVRFVISEPLVDALATVAGFGVNMITAYQSILDIRNLPDKSLDRQATEQSVNVNSQIKVLYRAPDFDTAEWGAKQSGTQFLTVPRFETTNIGKYGEETWGENRMLTSVEENLITENLLLGLKSRVAIVYRPGELASVCRTSWVPVTKTYDRYQVSLQPEAEQTDDRQPTAKPKQKAKPKLNTKPETKAAPTDLRAENTAKEKSESLSIDEL
jgi:type IV secretory pathway TraG/TraD family ATPase VirD4